MTDFASALADQTIRALRAGQAIPQVVAEVMRVFERDAPSNVPGKKQLRSEQLQLDYAAIGSRLDKLEAHAAEQLSDAVVAIRDQLSDRVREGLGSKFGSIKSLKLPAIESLGAAVRVMLLSAYSTGDRDLRGEARSGAKEYATKTYAEPLYTPKEAVRWLEQKAFWVTGVYEDQLISKAQQVLLNAIKTGEATNVTIDKLASVFGPYINSTVDAEVVTPARLQTIVRTNTTEAYNVGRITAAQDPDLADFSQGMLYSAVLDSRTTEVCRYLDGVVIPLDHPMLNRLAPPNHFNCRAILADVPVGIDIEARGWQMISEADVERAIQWGVDHDMESFLSHEQGCKCYGEESK